MVIDAPGDLPPQGAVLDSSQGVPDLLKSGREFFPALIGAIDAAHTEVLLETYIFSPDKTGDDVAQALARAARRGLRVRVVIDGFGTRPVPERYLELWTGSGAQVQVFSPVPALLTLDRARLRRLHRKLACIDGEIGFVGGINVLDDLWDPNHGALEYPRLDYAVRVRGRLAAEVRETMVRLWEQVSAPGTIGRNLGVRRSTAPAHGLDGSASVGIARADAAGGVRSTPARLILRDSLTQRRAIERAYLRAIGQARREVLIATAYFFPGRRFRRALREAAGRGVKVRLLLQGRAEYLLPHRAAQAMYDSMLSHGIEIHEYTRSFLHAKVAVIDDWATVGSSNIDPFSLLLSREANVVVQDRAFARQLKACLDQEIRDGASQVLMDHVRRRSWWRRLLGWMAYGLLRLGVRVSGERLDQ
jgi:cardiolipin synthase